MVYNNNSNSSNNLKTKNNKKGIYNIVDFPNKNQQFGNYAALFPKQAATEAFNFLSNILEEKINEEGKFIVFTIQNKDTKKEYKYIGTRIKLENPVVKYVNGNQVIYEYKNVIGKYNPALDKL